jgi:4a-hydroxytetrahydrobiopterin dehydratase
MSRALDPDEITRQLVPLDGWTGDGTGLRRAYTAPSFLEGVQLVTDVAEVAEEMDHHPDIDIRWRTVSFFLVTHSEDGVTQLDLELADRIARLADTHGAV